MGQLDRKTVLVTGGASGLGKAIAVRLAREGANVVITDIQSKLGAATADEHALHFLEQDVCDEERWAEVVHEVEAQHGGLDILVNSAGILGPMEHVSPEDTTLADWKRIFAVNVEGVFLGCRAALPVIARSGGGAIINISSIAGLRATPYATAYGASKAAVRQLTKSVAQHCAQEKLNIRCNSVHPGDVRTPLWDRGAEEAARSRGVPVDEVIAEHKAMVPLGDFTRAEDIAAAVAFLASDESRFVTGSKLVIDGGRVYCDSYRPSATSNPADRPSAAS
jgi:3(or 17)beta-hydroxysteroid dehydrogenase